MASRSVGSCSEASRSTGRTAAALLAHGLPAGVVHRVNAQLRGKFLARCGVASAAIAVARLLPFGAGAAVGAVAGAASSGAVVRATRKAFDV